MTPVDTYSYVGTSETVARIHNSVGPTDTNSLVDVAGDRLGVKQGTTLNWFLPDAHGDIAASLDNAEATVVNAIRYDAYGATIGTGTAGGTRVGQDNWKYQGRLDVSPAALATPLYDLSARFYAPGIGAFTSLDSVRGSAQDPLSMNRYLYAEANPATLVDPTGHCIRWQDDYCADHLSGGGANAIQQVHRQKVHAAEIRRRNTNTRRSEYDAENRVARHRTMTNRQVAKTAAARAEAAWTPPSLDVFNAMSPEEQNAYIAANGRAAAGWLDRNANTDAIPDNPAAFYVADAYQLSQDLAEARHSGHPTQGGELSSAVGLDPSNYYSGEQMVNYAGNQGASLAGIFIFGSVGMGYAGVSDSPAGTGGSREISGRSVGSSTSIAGEARGPTLNSAGRPYPNVTDPRSGTAIPAPRAGLSKVSVGDRVHWGAQERGAYIKDWYDRGHATPTGGWSGYDIHHIVPREYGGTNAFENLVPVPRLVHQQELNPWWREY
jgi:RHS repeat-associated protein